MPLDLGIFYQIDHRLIAVAMLAVLIDVWLVDGERIAWTFRGR